MSGFMAESIHFAQVLSISSYAAMTSYSWTSWEPFLPRRRRDQTKRIAFVLITVEDEKLPTLR